MSIAYYSAALPAFIQEPEDSILGKLSRNHRHDLEQEQKRAWIGQIRLLKTELAGVSGGTIYFEFNIPRMGKRADCILLVGSTVFVLEFKVGSDGFDRAAIEQVHDYALDLKNFHRGSHNAVVVPILIATAASSKSVTVTFAPDLVASPICLGATGLAEAILAGCGANNLAAIDQAAWESSGYQPTPTIIEAAQALYQNHNVLDISRSDAGAKNLRATNGRVAEIIERSKVDGRKSICFVTGVPGAGKTLAGLNIATLRALQHSDEHAVFLSGNGPLVNVLREALARDQKDRDAIKKKDRDAKLDADRKVCSFVQNIHHFRDAYLDDSKAPTEKVVVFDEAQRAWTQAQASKFMQRKRGQDGFSQSEPEFLVSVMDRHSDWCTIVCLIGGGQEINTGEAGITEWLKAVQTRFPHWDVHASALLDEPRYTVDAEARERLRRPAVYKHADLHLSVSMRSFRAEVLSDFVGAMLSGDADTAAALFQQVKGRYPIWLTRDLAAAKSWLRTVARGSERFGLVASSGARRLRPDGIHIKAAIDPPTWFLNDRHDVRSAFYLEQVATEFDVQGLELDWVGVCWDANFRYGHHGWETHAFRGTVWQSVNAADRRLYLVNAYRVLLTRARQGLVIYVPRGDEDDPTRPRAYYDGTHAFLQKCGLETLPGRVDDALYPRSPRAAE